MTVSQLFSNPEKDESTISREQLEELIELQSTILGETVTRNNYKDLLTRLCLLAEKLTPNAVASIMKFDEKQQQLFVHTAPSIPLDAIEKLNGLKPGDGSCGNAVHHNEEMFVCNTLKDARWSNVREFAEEYKIHACWSSPIHNESNEVIASFALSSFETRAPDNFQRRLINICASIAGLIFQREASLEEHQRWEKRLQESRENLSVTVNSIVDGVISTDVDDNIIIFNKVAEQLTGWPREQVIGKKIKSVFNVVDKEGNGIICNPSGCNSSVSKCFQENEDIRLLSADGAERYISISEAPLKNDDGETTGVVIAFRDTTLERANQRQLIESQQQYRSLVNNSADAIFLYNDNGKFIDVNQMACDSLGYCREELLTMSIPDIEITISDFSDFIQGLSLDNTFTVSGIQQRKDGSQFPVEARVRRYMSNDVTSVVAVVRDVSERKKEEKELLKARKLESIGLLAGGIAHDFNNLLGIIQGYVDLASRSTGKPEKTEKYLSKATKASVQAADLTQQLLTFSKGGEPIKQAAKIMDIIHQSTDFSLHGSNIQVNYDTPDDLWTADIDSGQISQVIQNLAINARQAMVDGGTLDITCKNIKLPESDKTSVLNQEKYIQVTVKDSGKGIPQDIIDSIFDPYFTTKEQGNGLGLALSYSIIQKHNGHIAVESTPDNGTCFTILLPTSEKQIETSSTQNPTTTSGTNKARVMIMDDDLMLREVSEEMLENLGYNVVQAEDGGTAKTLYQDAMGTEDNIDLIIMDLTIPKGIGGKEAIKLIREIDPDVKALVSSGYCNDPVMANYDEYGFMGAVKKPYSQDDLGEALELILQRNSA